MTTPERNGGRTVLIAADFSGHSNAALGLAVQMAAATRTHLQGLFVEDEDLLQLTGLPFTREISLVTAHERPTSVDQMQRALRHLASQFEQSLRREASALQITCSFESVRGRMRDIGLRSAANITYTILAQSGRLGSQARPERSPARLLWILRDSSRELRALEVLLERFRQRPVELVVVGSQPDIDAIEELRQWTQKTDRHIELQHWEPDQLKQQIAGGSLKFDAAVISRQQPAEQLTPILALLPCPVILVT
jgi:hypothetical protein